MKTEKIAYKGEPLRLDLYLKDLYLDYSREFLKKLINDGFVKVNGLSVKPSHSLKNGDEIEICENSDFKNKLEYKKMLIYEDDSIIVINKPAGLLVHPNDENWTRDLEALNFYEDNLLSFLYHQIRDKFENGIERFGLVHRLDKETSGVMLMAKTIRAQESLKDKFKNREIDKVYLCLVRGEIEKDFFIDAPIGRDSGDKRLRVHKYGRDALTYIELIQSNKDYSYIRVMPKTGRTNQIRVHLSHVGHEILGDRIYSKDLDTERLMLHSYKIAFKHPLTMKNLEFKAEPDAIFKKILKEKIKMGKIKY
jgi:23S rRNA pseudouridine1911/1915/1917 synthase